jgi:hypothetical protein
MRLTNVDRGLIRFGDFWGGWMVIWIMTGNGDIGFIRFGDIGDLLGSGWRLEEI